MTADKDTAGHGDVEVYNLDPARTPGGMKVRWRVRTATGKEAERLEKQQNQVIIRLLTWADQYLREQEESTTHRHGNALSSHENDRNVSRETTGNIVPLSPGRNIIRSGRPPDEKGQAA